MVLPAHSFEEWAEGALAAQGLGQEVEGVLRAALVEVALGLVAAARGEEAGVRRAVLEEEAARAAGTCGAAARDIAERRTAS